MARFVPGFRPPDECRDGAVWIVLDASGSLIRRRDRTAFVLDGGEVELLGVSAEQGVFVGLLDDRPCYAVEVGAEKTVPDDDWEACPLREIIGSLDDDESAMTAAARQLLHWQETHRFCGRCGAAMTNKADERAKLCPACGHIAFPRMNPAIIVAVRRGNELLLGRNSRFRIRRMFSLVAGYVEVGESLEQAVRREVAEEVGLSVRHIEYFGSQPWPFPSTLMLGFRAEYAGGEIRLADEELIEAGWFAADALPEIPRPGSISRALIDDFVRTHGEAQ